MLHYICNRISYLEKEGRNYEEELNTIEDILNDIQQNFADIQPPKEDRALLMYAFHRLKLARCHSTQLVAPNAPLTSLPSLTPPEDTRLNTDMELENARNIPLDQSDDDTTQSPNDYESD